MVSKAQIRYKMADTILLYYDFVCYLRRAEEHAKSRHFLINMSVPNFPAEIVLEPPE